MNGLFSTLFRGSDKRRAYNQLSQLDDHLLRDIGLNRSDLRTMIAARSKVSRSHG